MHFYRLVACRWISVLGILFRLALPRSGPRNEQCPIRWNIRIDDAVRSNPHMISDPDITKGDGAGRKRYIASDNGPDPLLPIMRRIERHAVRDYTIVTKSREGVDCCAALVCQ